ncbi:thiosulfate sulfurtransferase [Bacillaceae bacterium JMAK1]|nr:thiosulfate sulfurtransferase [Bacillaceae bacterium JMAK1]
MTNQSPLVTTEWLQEHLEDPKVRIIDATTFLMPSTEEGRPYDVKSGKEAYEEGHIPGAVYGDIAGELADSNSSSAFTVPSEEQFKNAIEQLGVSDDTHVIVYDQIAVVGTNISASDWASRLWWHLRFEGFENVSILEGGFRKWKHEGRNVETGTNEYPKGNVTLARKQELLATKEDVKRATTDSNTVLLNCLSPADFSGEKNTYGRPGHIPTSHNVFFASLNDDETFKVREEQQLRDIFEPTGALDSDKKVIAYCGGGIAATWNAFVLYLLGKKDVAVYDGSMTEWAGDSSLPLHTK